MFFSGQHFVVLNFAYYTHRSMDRDGDMKVDLEEFLSACLGDEELCRLLESGLGQEMWGTTTATAQQQGERKQ